MNQKRALEENRKIEQRKIKTQHIKTWGCRGIESEVYRIKRIFSLVQLCNRIPQIRGLDNTNLFLTVLEVGSLRSRSSRVGFR
jgi:hypothetical protein